MSDLRHSLALAELKLPVDDSYEISDVLDGNQSVPLNDGTIQIENQRPHSVRLLKIIDTSISSAPPNVSASAPSRAKRSETIEFTAQASAQGVPAVTYRWDFGDGVSTEGPSVSHAYTRIGIFNVRLTVKGADGLAAQKTFSITVRGEAKTSPPRRYVQPDR